MPARFLCVCRYCLGKSPEGVYFKQERTIRAHIDKYGTENMDASQSRLSSAASKPRAMDYTTADVSRALQLILSGAQVPSRTPDKHTERLGPGPQSPNHDACGPQFEQDYDNMSGLNSREEDGEDGGQDLPMHAEHSDSDDKPDPGCQEQMQQEPPDDDDDSHRDNHDDSSAEDDVPASDSGDTGATPEYHIEEIQIARKFIVALERASPDDLDLEIRHQIQNPPCFLPTLSVSQRHALDVFLATTNASEETYNLVRAAYMRRHPSDPNTGTESDMLSLYQVKKLVQSLSGVVPVAYDMCYKSCAGFTGPFSHLRICPFCGEDRYTTSDGSIPRKQFQTIPIGPQLQALWRSPEGADAMQYRRVYTQHIVDELNASEGEKSSPYRDFLDGSDYVEALASGHITEHDMILMMSIDGAQLYRMKSSDCWIYIWVILDLNPNVRYQKKHVLVGGVVPGPDKPKNLDSFIFPGLHHLSVIQRHGLRVWNGRDSSLFTSYPFLMFVTADGPAMAAMNGCVGHHGKYGCRLFCPLSGRHKSGISHYYPAIQRPLNFHVSGSDHGDVNLRLLLRQFDSHSARQRYNTNLQIAEASRNPTQYERNRLETGICRPTIFLGLSEKHRLAIPGLFPGDNMHLPCLNITDLFIPLWRGTFTCESTDSRQSWDWAVLTGNTWKEHGALVAAATPWIPGSFDRPPRNPAEKISSGYKAWEYLLYFYGLGPALLHGILSRRFYQHYCKGVSGIRHVLEEQIPPSDLHESDTYILEWSSEFETLYVQRRQDRLHFVRQSMHAPVHMPHETVRCGPGKIYSPWVIERTIGNLGEEIRQHSNPFANLAQPSVCRCQVNALKAIIPDLDPDYNPSGRIAQNAIDIGDGYLLLPARDTTSRIVRAGESPIIQRYFVELGARESLSTQNGLVKVRRWARLRLPNGQVARSLWKESRKPLGKLRCARHVKIIDEQNHTFQIAEVYYYLLLQTATGINKACALVSFFGPPDAHLLEESYKMYYTAKHQGDSGLAVVDVCRIKSVVMMAPDTRFRLTGYWYLMEKPGLRLFQPLEEDTEQDLEN